jgi:hypothetical protein
VTTRLGRVWEQVVAAGKTVDPSHNIRGKNCIACGAGGAFLRRRCPEAGLLRQEVNAKEFERKARARDDALDTERKLDREIPKDLIRACESAVKMLRGIDKGEIPLFASPDVVVRSPDNPMAPRRYLRTFSTAGGVKTAIIQIGLDDAKGFLGIWKVHAPPLVDVDRMGLIAFIPNRQLRTRTAQALRRQKLDSVAGVPKALMEILDYRPTDSAMKLWQRPLGQRKMEDADA